MKQILTIVISIIAGIGTAVAQVAMTPVVNPTVPEQVEFAGQVYTFDNPDLRERMDRELASMSFGHTNTLLLLKRAARWRPVIEPILRSEGVPEDLFYMAAIESTLNPFAVSPAKAAGLWQFMPSTGKEYGLEVNDYVDQRYDPEPATRAACRYLKEALSRYGNWETVAASYNAGMGRLSRELTAQDEHSALDLWLPQETMRYFLRMLAAKLIMEHPEQYGFRITPEQLYEPRQYRTVEVSEPVDDWAQWAREHDTNYLTLREHNPWIRSRELPNKNGKTYRVKIPVYSHE